MLRMFRGEGVVYGTLPCCACFSLSSLSSRRVASKCIFAPLYYLLFFVWEGFVALLVGIPVAATACLCTS